MIINTSATENLIIVAICALLALAVYMIAASVFKLPTQKSIDVLLKANKGIDKDVFFASSAKKISKFIHLDNFQIDKFERVLELYPRKVTAQEYVAQCILFGLVVSLVGMFLFVVSPLLGFLGLISGPVFGYLKYKEAFNEFEKHKKSIEKEVPRFAQTIFENLKISRDVIAILTTYKAVANKALAYELEKTIADMRTSNYESALMRFDTRLGISSLSELIRGLIGSLRGDDQTTYFEHLSFEMRHLEENMIRKEAMKRPTKMHLLSMAMLSGFLLMLVAVCGTMLLNSFTQFGM